MNMSPAPTASYVGANAANFDAQTSKPLQIDTEKVKVTAELNRDNRANPVAELSEEQHKNLMDYLTSRISAGIITRDRRKKRYAKIDRSISTWQKLSPKESERENIEDSTGHQMALPMNLPLLASHLNDMVSYYTESLAPIANPFFTVSGEAEVKALADKMSRDAIARSYYAELSLTLRSLLKYNIGGFNLSWQEANEGGGDAPGNLWKSLDMYNTLWDPSVRNPTDVSRKGEWAATVRMENRLELMRKTLDGKWHGLDKLLESQAEYQQRQRFYCEASVEANMGIDGQDTHTSQAGKKGAGQVQGVNWDAFGLGLANDLGPEIDGFEVIKIYCWLIPAQFGLLTDEERNQLQEASTPIDPDTFLELWEFEIVDGNYVVSASPVAKREESIGGAKPEIPLYLAYLTKDQLKEAQRSFMELMRGFQRFASAMFNIYIAGMRKNVWGVKGVDPQMFDASSLSGGDTVGVLESKQPGRDVRQGLMTLDSSAGVEGIMGSIAQVLQLKDGFFPSQALPSQVAGIDRAVKSQVASVIQGAQRSQRMLLRVLDSDLMLPVRLASFRNLKRFDGTDIANLTDEIVAKLTGSGIESMEAERVAEALQNLLFAIIQNQESMQTFDVPKILTYMSRVMNLSVDLGQFVKQAPQTQPPPAGAEDNAPPPQA